MASLLRKTRNAQGGSRKKDPRPKNTNLDPVRGRRGRGARGIIEEIEEKDETIDDSFNKIFKGADDLKHTAFMEKPLEDIPDIDFQKLKKMEPTIKKKLNEILKDESLDINDIDSFYDFNQQKTGVLQRVVELMDEKIDEYLVKIDKLELDKQKTENKIMELVRKDKEKYEISGLIQRKRNITDRIDQLERGLMKSERLKNSVENFIIFGDLSESFKDFNEVSQEFMKQNHIYLDAPEDPIINLSLLHDFLRRETKYEQKYEELKIFSKEREKNLIDREYLNYKILCQKYT